MVMAMNSMSSMSSSLYKDRKPSSLGAPRQNQNLTSMARFNRFSFLRRSGNQVFAGDPLHVANPARQTNCVGLPVLPPGGVMPPEPEK